MTPSDALRRVVEHSDKSTRQIAYEIDRSDSFIRTTIAQGVRPRLDTFVSIASVCGYEVVVRSDDDEFVLDFSDSQPVVEYDSSRGKNSSQQ